MSSVIGVDVGGSLLRAALFDEHLTLLQRAEQPTPVKGGQAAMLEALYETIRQVLPEDPHDLSGIGVGLPGPLDIERGTVIHAPNLPFEPDLPIARLIREAVGGPVFLGNDADVAGLAEWSQGAGVGTRNMLYITVSTGVGGGIIVAGEVYSGRGQGGEIGHMVVMPEGGPLCGCGKRGHLEALASGTAIAREAREALAQGRDSLIREMVGGDQALITAKLVGQAAAQGDGLAREVYAQAGRYLGIGLASLLVILNPDRVVMGGGVARAGDLLLGPMREALAENILHPRYIEQTPIVPAGLGADTGLIGAAALVGGSK
jgi:glucokinase